MDSLVKIGAVPRTQIIEIDSRLSELARQRGELVGNKAQSEKAAAGAQLALTGIESDFQSTIAGEITTARIDLADVEEQITASKDVLRRLEIRSPQDGIISNILLRTLAVPSRPASHCSRSFLKTSHCWSRCASILATSTASP